MDPGRALASLRALKSQPIPLARTAVEPRPVVEKRRSPHAARLQQKRANSGVLCPPLPPDELVSPRSLSLPRAQLLLDASDATAFAATAPTKPAEPAPPTGLAALERTDRAREGSAATLAAPSTSAPRTTLPRRRGGRARRRCPWAG